MLEGGFAFKTVQLAHFAVHLKHEEGVPSDGTHSSL